MTSTTEQTILASCVGGRYAVVAAGDRYEVRVMLGENAGHVLDSRDTLSGAQDRLAQAEHAYYEREERDAKARAAQRRHIARRR